MVHAMEIESKDVYRLKSLADYHENLSSVANNIKPICEDGKLIIKTGVIPTYFSKDGNTADRLAVVLREAAADFVKKEKALALEQINNFK